MQLKAVAGAAFAASVTLAWADAPAHHVAVRDYKAVALAPSGERIAAIESVDDGVPGKRAHAIVVVRDARSGRVLHEYDPCKACTYDRPSWSPDGKTVAFIGSAGGKAMLYAGTRLLATVDGNANTARWSPDGKQLALLATLGAKKETGATAAGARLVGEIGSNEDAQRIATVPAAGGTVKLLSPADTFIYEYDWTPDGNGFVATGAQGNGDNNWWVAKLAHVDASSGALRVIATPATQLNMPRVSPDGGTVAFIGGLMSDFGSVGGDLYTVPLAGGTPKNITPGFKGTFNGIAWKSAGLVGTALMGDQLKVLRVGVADGATTELWSAPVTAAGGTDGRLSFSADGAAAAGAVEDFERGPRLIAGTLPELAQVTHDNDSLVPQVAVRNVAWQNEGYANQGWLVGPLRTEPGKRYPMIVQVHGGPASAATPRYLSAASNPNVHALVGAGYFVLMPNPRGSFGQGQAFASANRRDFGGGDLRDILAGVDAAAQAAPVDTARLGLMGHSYGGFMTMWGVTHSDRFKAAVAGAGVANWISYYGQNGIDQWMVPFFGATMYDDPAIYRKLSPIEYIKAARTPTLVYVGERDVETPAAQSMEFWHGLKALNVPTALVIYEGEGHGIRKPEHKDDLRKRIVEWFNRYL
ncbi:dipeptidyl aminopeptidase/acylaminoacyl peptidase [Pseudoduganella flava]|uniref:Alpha/beta fold hydrolase n=1 Tax=Pseudoduganella flava TaxID=871742 RepID=A0A562PDY5_9BURK|nr:S9 family peptidase [Pseudoduganella flava]QGZ40058.1 alpha/beta fold hydrolase [Pseudoduganella flava]TWI42196.1 dipeptidyl aminopeptidase/acylaminoacyl peptidase [Pseudoduganella flava]